MISTQLSTEEQATCYQIMQHIERLRNLLNRMAIQLLQRGELHDQSKLKAPEIAAYTANFHLLKDFTFGSPEYEANKAKTGMNEALAHHYAQNRHHPEHFKHGLSDMDMIDVLEMLCDWKASSELQLNGNLRKSIEVNGRRFGMSSDLIRLFENTVPLLEG